MKKNINTISMHGEKFYQFHTETTLQQLSRPLNGLEKNGSFRKVHDEQLMLRRACASANSLQSLYYKLLLTQNMEVDICNCSDQTITPVSVCDFTYAR